MSDYRLLNDVQLWKARRRKKLDKHTTEVPGKRELLDHIDAMAAREAKLRELHRLQPPRWEDDYSQDCEHCFDGSYTQDHRTWPCNTIRILDGDE